MIKYVTMRLNNKINMIKLNESIENEEKVRKWNTIEKRRRFLTLKVSKILWVKGMDSLNIPDHTLSRMFQKWTVDLKKRFQVSKRVKAIWDLEILFQTKLALIESWHKDYKDLHILEVIYYICKSQNQKFLEDLWFSEETLKELYKEVLIPSIQGWINIFKNTKKHHDIHQYKKLLKFREILHHYNISDEDIGISKWEISHMKEKIKS